MDGCVLALLVLLIRTELLVCKTKATYDRWLEMYGARGQRLWFTHKYYYARRRATTNWAAPQRVPPPTHWPGPGVRPPGFWGPRPPGVDPYRSRSGPSVELPEAKRPRKDIQVCRQAGPASSDLGWLAATEIAGGNWAAVDELVTDKFASGSGGGLDQSSRGWSIPTQPGAAPGGGGMP